jgi:hypothetical protein
MWFLNRTIGRLVELLLLPFRGLPAWVGLAVVSTLAAVLMLLIFKAKSDQKRLARTKRLIYASILEIRLFNEQPRLVLAAQGDVLRQSFRYIGLTLVPLLWMALPLLLLMTQLQAYYGYRGLGVGESAIVTVRLENESVLETPLALEADAGLEVQTPLLAIPALSEAGWRVAARTPGEHVLRLRVGSEVLTKTVVVSDGLAARSARRPGSNLLQQLLYPTEPPLSAGTGITAIDVRYAEGEVNLIGWDVHWIIAFFILTLVAAFALRRPLRVTF